MNDDTILDQELAEEPKDNSVDLPVVAPPKMKITASQADAAARRAGMRTLKAGKFKGVAEFGHWVEQCGAFRMGLGMIAFTAEQLQDGIEKCAALDKEISDPEVRANLLGISRDLTEQYAELAKALLKAGDKTPAASQPTIPQVPSPPPGLAVQFNIGTANQKQ
jgi:hypothetical protein